MLILHITRYFWVWALYCDSASCMWMKFCFCWYDEGFIKYIFFIFPLHLSFSWKDTFYIYLVVAIICMMFYQLIKCLIWTGIHQREVQGYQYGNVIHYDDSSHFHLCRYIYNKSLPFVTACGKGYPIFYLHRQT
jgi:hypothetical protein